MQSGKGFDQIALNPLDVKNRARPAIAAKAFLVHHIMDGGAALEFEPAEDPSFVKVTLDIVRVGRRERPLGCTIV